MFKKILTFILPLAFIAGCNVEEIDQTVDSNREYPEFKAYMDSFGTDTKTAIDKDRYILWQENEDIYIFHPQDLHPYSYRLTSGAGKTQATFEKSKFTPEPDTRHPEMVHYVAISPGHGIYSRSMNGTDYQINGFSIPATQNYVKDSYDPAAFPMVAVSDNNILSFKNAAGILKLEVQGFGVIKSIVLTAKQYICGSAVIKASADNVPVLELSGEQDNANSVTLSCGEGVQLSAGKATVFHIVLPPVDLSEGFQVEIVENGGEHMILKAPAGASQNIIKRNDILKMPVITYQAGILVNISDMIDGGIGF